LGPILGDQGGGGGTVGYRTLVSSGRLLIVTTFVHSQVKLPFVKKCNPSIWGKTSALVWWKKKGRQWRPYDITAETFAWSCSHQRRKKHFWCFFI